MKGFYKKHADGSIQRSDAIYAPGYSLTEANKTDAHDGWIWFDVAEDAYAHFAAPDNAARLATMNGVYETLPELVQVQFEPAWTIVRNLVQSGKDERARRFIENLSVPTEFENIKASILELFV